MNVQVHIPPAEPQDQMRLGLFLMPCSYPDTPLGDVIDWYSEVIREADRFGYAEAWIGAHTTSKYERIVSPQQMIARSLGETKQIVLGTGIEVLYQNHPITLAVQLAQLDHMARGRLLFGFGAGSTLTDNHVYGVDMKTSQEMAAEALEIIHNVWQPGGPTAFKGKFWSVAPPDSKAVYFEDHTHGWHIQTYASPENRIAIAGFQQNSPSMRMAGARGYIPLSLNISPEYLADHWAAVSEGAAAAGVTADRRRWRQTKEIYVAETMAEARRGAKEGFLNTFWDYAQSYFTRKPDMIDLYRRKGADPAAPVTVDYLIDNGVWMVGTPDSVAAQIKEQFEISGGFGTLLQLGLDYSRPEQRDGWMRSMQLLAQEVMPKVRHLVPAPV
jgi:alkanesulfonate monooxygenase SsuD/methylene tetrahydromethanopterin reductase-like flavin-dependent oxidoreductase (luciferase family)